MERVSETARTSDGDLVVDEAVELVARWLERAATTATGEERRVAGRLHEVIQDPAGVAFAMRFVDRVVRPEDDDSAAQQLSTLVRRRGIPGFLSSPDKILLGVGARLATHLPDVVIPLAQRRMRQLVGHLIADAEDEALSRHLADLRTADYRVNVNLLGEAVLGPGEADRRLHDTMELLTRPDVDYVSVKVSSVVANLNPWDLEGDVDAVIARLRPLFSRAVSATPPKFVNLDMEEYHDLELTIRAFTAILEEPEFHALDAGIVLQTYLPDSYPVLRGLVEWANRRKAATINGRPGGSIKIRLVKGANLAMERVEAAMKGWEQAPYATKAETDANYKRCLDWVLRPERLTGTRIGVASHNLFDIAWTHLLSEARGVSHRVEFEMLQGMAPAQSRQVRATTGNLLLYTPVVKPGDFDVAIAYLFRRLEENASEDNFIRHLFSIRRDGPAFEAEKAKFAAAVSQRWTVGEGPRRRQNRRAEAAAAAVIHPGDEFRNEPDTDPVLEANRVWIRRVLAQAPDAPKAGVVTTATGVDEQVTRAQAAAQRWAGLAGIERRRILANVGDELSTRRGDLIAALVHEGNKTVAEADTEVSEAIDFARWYARSAETVGQSPSARFSPLGVVAVIPPWNFPVAIPAGGVLAALAAGNTVVLKPAPSTPRCAEIVAECCWAAGVGDALAYLRIADGPLGRQLVTHPSISGIIFTGSWETAKMFRQWRPGLPIFGETSGKNAMIITPHADLDQAVADLVSSAFAHGGQKCSAASLAICVGDVYESPRFRRQLVDAVTSLRTGPASDRSTDIAPLIGGPSPKLRRALERLEQGEDWLVAPHRHDDDLWSPGIRLGVRPGSFFHQVECFGPVLGLMQARDLDEAIAVQNANDYGLTGGLHSLDPVEIEQWCDRVQVGNAYVNRTTTGAIVGRQPFGGWKRSVVGPGAKAGGSNYVQQLGRWRATDGQLDDAVWLTNATVSDSRWWSDEFGVERDLAGLFCEANRVRYRPLPRIALRLQPDGLDRELQRAQAAARICRVPVVVSDSAAESAADFAARLPTLGVERIRVIGTVDPALRQAANDAGIHLADAPVTSDGRLELAHYLREQVVSHTLHRYGNLLA